MTARELDDLIDAWCDGVIDAQGQVALDRALASDPAFARHAARRFDLHHQLDPDGAESPGSDRMSIAVAESAWPRRMRSLALAASVPAAAVLLVLLHLRDAAPSTTDGHAPDAASAASKPVTTVLVPRSATWRYHDNGVTPVGDWTATTYDDLTWALGAAPLGYDRSHVSHRFATVVGTGATAEHPDEAAISTWFRHRFVVDDARAVRRLVARIERDDGAVVYLNGVEVARSCMPDGALTPQTRAVRAKGAPTVDVLELSTTPLREGPNVLAVEVHQRSATSSDILFALELSADR